jgi:hypothetical protein
MEDRVFLNYEQAVAMLPDKDTIHTFINIGGVLIGADWNRISVLEELAHSKPELSGTIATSIGHGIVFERGGDYVFVETRVLETDKN